MQNVPPGKVEAVGDLIERETRLALKSRGPQGLDTSLSAGHGQAHGSQN
jgi:hypothetical protein